MTPFEASKKENEKEIFERAYAEDVPCGYRFKRPKYKIGDRVRISTFKSVSRTKKHVDEKSLKTHRFQNKYEYTNWSRQIFIITGVRFTDPPTYVLKDPQGVLLKAKFYEHELQTTKF